MINEKCPVCGSEENRYKGKPFINNIARSIIKNDYSVVQCLSCVAYYVSPKINFTRDEWKLLYNQEYFAVQTDWLIKTRKKELQNRIDRLEKAVNRNNVNFLDVGCGEGNASFMAMERGWNVTAIDITDNRGEAAKKSKMNFIEGELTSLKLQSGGFDVVYMDSVLEHVINPVDYLMEIFRLLNNGGVLYIGVPNEDALQNDVKKIIYNFTGKKGIAPQLKPFDTPYHIVGFNKKSLNYIINKCGFNKIELRNFGRKCEFLGSPAGTKGFYFNLLMLPFEVLGYIMRRDVYYEAILIKNS